MGARCRLSRRYGALGLMKKGAGGRTLADGSGRRPEKIAQQ
jgi:hypothetical protein